MIGKILLTLVVIVFVWAGFKYLARMAELRQRGPAAPPRRPGRVEADTEAESMVECRVCGTWQPAKGAKSCGRADCPY